MNLDLTIFPETDSMILMPIMAFCFAKPVDGFPPRIQWEKFMESIWTNYEKLREPLEIHPITVRPRGTSQTFGSQPHPTYARPGEAVDPTSVGFTKGYTRASVIMFGIIQTLLIEDQQALTEPEREFFTEQLYFNSDIIQGL